MNVPIVKTECDLIHSHNRRILSQFGPNFNLAVNFTTEVLQDDPPQLHVLVDPHEPGVYLPVLKIYHDVLNSSILRQEILHTDFS